MLSSFHHSAFSLFLFFDFVLTIHLSIILLHVHSYLLHFFVFQFIWPICLPSPAIHFHYLELITFTDLSPFIQAITLSFTLVYDPPGNDFHGLDHWWKVLSLCEATVYPDDNPFPSSWVTHHHPGFSIKICAARTHNRYVAVLLPILDEFPMPHLTT